jgi:exosortase
VLYFGRSVGGACPARTGMLSATHMRRALLGLLAPLITLAIAYHYAPVLVWLARSWVTRPQYSHGALVAAASLLLVWLSRGRIARAKRGAGWGGVGLVSVALVLRRWDLGASEPSVAALGIPFLVLGMVWALSGPDVARVIAAPVLLVLLAIPLPSGILASVGMRVEYWAATAGAALLERVFSIPATREGVMIHLPRVSLEMGIQPAALQLLMAFTTFAAFYAYLLAGPAWKRWAVFAGGGALSVLAPGVRMGLDGLVGHILGPYAMRSCHHWSGYIALGVALAGLIVFARALGCEDLRLPGSPSTA